MDSVYSVCKNLCDLFCFVLFCAGDLRHTLQDRLRKASSAKPQDQIKLKLRTSTGLYLNEW